MRLFQLALMATCAGCYSGALLAQTASGDPGPLTAAQISMPQPPSTGEAAPLVQSEIKQLPQYLKSQPAPQLPIKTVHIATPQACAIPLVNALANNPVNAPMPRVVPRQSTDPGMPIVAGLPTCGEPPTPAAVTTVRPRK